MAVMISGDQLLRASLDALGRVHEFGEGAIEEKLAVFGLDTSAVHTVLRARWEAYCYEGAMRIDEETGIVFVRAFVEGLITGLQVNQS